MAEAVARRLVAEVIAPRRLRSPRRMREAIRERRVRGLESAWARVLQPDRPRDERTFRTMDREQLQTFQRPLKERYREEPAAALVTLRAEGTLEGEEIVCSVATGRALVEAGLHPATGGSGELACSGDMLLQALVACAGVTLRSVATSLEIPVTGTVSAEGDLDFRGTLGVDKTGGAPVGFRAIRLRFALESDAADEQLATLLRLTERYCVVYQTLTGGVPVDVSSESQPQFGAA